MTVKHKKRIEKRNFAYVYLLYRMFDGDQEQMLKVLENYAPTDTDIKEWDEIYKEAAIHTIEEESIKGQQNPVETDEVPTIKSIKEKVLRRVDALISATTDPARLAQVYKTLSEFEGADDKKEKSVLDAISDSIKPIESKNEQVVSVLDTICGDNKLPVNKKRRGRPRKVNPEEIAEQIIEEQVEE